MTATLAPPSAPVTPAPRKARRRTKTGKAGPVTYSLLVLFALVSVFPLYWTVVAGSHTNAEIAATPPPFLPNATLFENIDAALEQAPLGLAILNSVIVSGAAISVMVILPQWQRATGRSIRESYRRSPRLNSASRAREKAAARHPGRRLLHVVSI